MKRFRVFVSNKQQLIRSYSEKSDWRYIDTKKNPADDASRGLSMRQTDKVQRWMRGPEILYQEEGSWDKPEENHVVSEEDPEVVKAVNVCAIKSDDVIDRLERRFSRWAKTKRVMALVQRFIRKLKENVKAKAKVIKRTLSEAELREAEAKIMDQLSVEDVEEAETAIVKMTQQKYFAREIAELNMHAHTSKVTKLKKKSLGKIYKIDPFMDDKGVLPVLEGA